MSYLIKKINLNCIYIIKLTILRITQLYSVYYNVYIILYITIKIILLGKNINILFVLKKLYDLQFPIVNSVLEGGYFYLIE